MVSVTRVIATFCRGRSTTVIDITLSLHGSIWFGSMLLFSEENPSYSSLLNTTWYILGSKNPSMPSKTFSWKPKWLLSKKTIVSCPGCFWNVLGVTFVKNLQELCKIYQKLQSTKISTFLVSERN